MLQILTNPIFQKAISNAAISLVKIGTMTVGSVFLSQATHRAGKDFLAEMAQHHRLLKYEEAQTGQ